MWGRNKETCCDYSDQNIQQLHYKFDFRIRTWYIINLHAATGEKRFLPHQGRGGCCRRFFNCDEIMMFLSPCEFIEKSYMLHGECYIYFKFFQLFGLVQSSRCHPDADLGFSAMLCTERGVIIQ